MECLFPDWIQEGIGKFESFISQDISPIDSRIAEIAKILKLEGDDVHKHQVSEALLGLVGKGEIETLEKCIDLMSDELLDLLFSSNQERVLEYIKNEIELFRAENDDEEEVHWLISELRSLFDFYIAVFDSFISSVLTVFNLSSEGSGDVSRFDANSSFDMQAKFLALPLTALVVLAPSVAAIGVPLYLLLALVVSLAVLTGLWIYKKLRGAPASPANFINLSQMIREGNRNFIQNGIVAGREAEVEKLGNIFANANNESKNVLIKGKHGVGKTVLLYEFARQNPDIEVYYLDSSKVANSIFNTTEHFTAMYRDFCSLNKDKKVVLCFDEVHEFFRKKESSHAASLNNFLSRSGALTISLTSEEYHIIEDYYSMPSDNDLADEAEEGAIEVGEGEYSGAERHAPEAFEGVEVEYERPLHRGEAMGSNPFVRRQNHIIDLPDLSFDSLVEALHHDAMKADLPYDYSALEAIAKRVNEEVSSAPKVGRALDLLKAALLLLESNEDDDLLARQLHSDQQKLRNLRTLKRLQQQGGVGKDQDIKNTIEQIKNAKTEIEKRKAQRKEIKEKYADLKMKFERQRQLEQKLANSEAPPNLSGRNHLSDWGRFYLLQHLLIPGTQNRVKNLEKAFEGNVRLTAELVNGIRV